MNSIFSVLFYNTTIVFPLIIAAFIVTPIVGVIVGAVRRSFSIGILSSLITAVIFVVLLGLAVFGSAYLQ